MTNSSRQARPSSNLGRKKIAADSAGGMLASDAGGLLRREVDGQRGLIDGQAAGRIDPRDPAKITHDLRTMLAQRIYSIALPAPHADA